MTINQNQDTVAVSVGTTESNLNLTNTFDDTRTSGLIATFNFYEDSFAQDIRVLLFDQPTDGAPGTVANFIRYVEDGDYNNSIIHRLVQDFVIQGGGFVVNNLQVGNVTPNPPITNEFSDQRSNTRGTIAMAKQAGDPNSATSQWFFNVSDNSSNLDNQNGGFTVFGEVLEEDLTALDALNSLPVFNGTTINSAFTDLPLNSSSIQNDNDFIRLENISLNNQTELTFEIENNTNPDFVTASLNDNNELSLTYTNTNAAGFADIVINTTDILGQTFSETIRVSVVDNLDTTLTRYQNSDLPGTFLFATEEERESIAQFPQFVEEGDAFTVSDQPDDGLIVFNRFRNDDVPGTYLYADERESRNIRQQFPQFVEEGPAFYAYGADAGRGENIYRFQNSQQQGTFIFVNESERQTILADFPQFIDEGVAFEALI